MQPLLLPHLPSLLDFTQLKPSANSMDLLAYNFKFKALQMSDWHFPFQEWPCIASPVQSLETLREIMKRIDERWS
jgi:hypothetical protein